LVFEFPLRKPPVELWSGDCVDDVMPTPDAGDRATALIAIDAAMARPALTR
jgi:hypothetical protein